MNRGSPCISGRLPQAVGQYPAWFLSPLLLCPHLYPTGTVPLQSWPSGQYIYANGCLLTKQGNGSRRHCLSLRLPWLLTSCHNLGEEGEQWPWCQC